jgi:RimJ/RimL family protein N-acetyltransferase
MTEVLPSTDQLTVGPASPDTVWLKRLADEDAAAFFDLIEFDRDHLSQFGMPIAADYTDKRKVLFSIGMQQYRPDLSRFGIWDGDVLVGSNMASLRAGNRAELSTWIGKEHIGHAYASRARDLLVDYAFHTLNVGGVYSRIVVGNEPSRRSVEKSGFTYTGEVIEMDGTRTWHYIRQNTERHE